MVSSLRFRLAGRGDGAIDGQTRDPGHRWHRGFIVVSFSHESRPDQVERAYTGSLPGRHAVRRASSATAPMSTPPRPLAAVARNRVARTPRRRAPTAHSIPVYREFTHTRACGALPDGPCTVPDSPGTLDQGARRKVYRYRSGTRTRHRRRARRKSRPRAR